MVAAAESESVAHWTSFVIRARTRSLLYIGLQSQYMMPNVPLISPVCTGYRPTVYLCSQRLTYSFLNSRHLAHITSSQSLSSLSQLLLHRSFSPNLNAICFTNPFLLCFSVWFQLDCLRGSFTWTELYGIGVGVCLF